MFDFFSFRISRFETKKTHRRQKRCRPKEKWKEAAHQTCKVHAWKMETEVFLDFTAQHPEIKIKHRKFESLKIIFVQSVKEKEASTNSDGV